MVIYSLKNHNEFDLVSKSSIRLNSVFFTILYSSNFLSIRASRGSRDYPFVGIKVSRYFSKKAVIRNKVKRQIRHIMRNLVNKQVIYTKNTAFIIIPKQQCISAKFLQMEDDLNNILLSYKLSNGKL